MNDRIRYLIAAGLARGRGDKIAYRHLLGMLWLWRAFPETVGKHYLRQVRKRVRDQIPACKLALFWG